MKNTYYKPDILFESFSLSTNIAAGCGMKTPLPQSNECGLPYFNWIIFQNEFQGCTKIVATGIMDGICYHPPTEQTNLFTS